ncbi:MAG: alpha/beta fold hydrolase [Microcoleaceae cyanobacterium]
MVTTQWQHRVGQQRDWVWRGWRIRYTYVRSRQPAQPAQPPIILLHGFGASIGHWRQNFEQLSQHHTVYALDLLGFGASEKAITAYNVSLWVDLVDDFWQTFIGKPAILIGNSIGSLVSLVAAAERPNLAQGLVMISLPDPGVQTEMMPPWLVPIVDRVQSFVASPVILQPLFYLVRRPGVVRRWARLAYHNPDAITDELVDILSLPARDRRAARAFSRLFSAMGSPRLGPAVKTVLPNLTIPVLLIWGKFDRLIPIQLANPRKYLEYNPNIRLVELEDAGHCPHDECPEKVNQEILNWLDSITNKTIEFIKE